MAFHPKAMQAGNCALGLWVRAGAWAASARSEGYVPRQVAYRMGTRTQIESLIICGLWEVKNGGYVMHDWHHYQPSKEAIESKREADRLRKREQRKRGNVPPDKRRDKPRDSARSPTIDVPLDVRPESSRAGLVPSLPSSGYGGGGSAVGSASALEPADAGPHQNQFCEKHMPNGTDKPCRECQRIREYNDHQQTIQAAAERRKRRTEINNCDYCDDSGMRETPEGLKRCIHKPLEVPF
jgi:hypothetical protein